MNLKFGKNLLGVYDLILSIGAVIMGILMIQSSYGIFVEYPKEWLHKVPFDSWVMPSVIAIVLFGLGNLTASIFSFWEKGNRPWLVSAIMGGILFISLIIQVIVLGECYLPTIEFLILSIIQLLFSGYVLFVHRKSQRI